VRHTRVNSRLQLPHKPTSRLYLTLSPIYFLAEKLLHPFIQIFGGRSSPLCNMKVETFPASRTDNHEPLINTQSEAVPPTTNVSRRPVPSRTATAPSLQDNRTWDEKSEHETLLSTTEGSERSFNDPDTGLSTPTLQSEYHALPVEEVRCSLLPNRSAAWVIYGKDLRLSPLAAAVLLHENKIKVKDLDLYFTLVGIIFMH
jgi:hypothetical protein